MNRYSQYVKRIMLPKSDAPFELTPSICFMGGGNLWTFAIGVGHFIFRTYSLENVRFLASSSGCFAAVPLACGMDPYEWCKADWGKCITHFSSRRIPILARLGVGCLLDEQQFYYNLWNDYLPEDAHKRCTGRLFISVTHFPKLSNELVSAFESREQLIQTIVASMCLPICFIRDFPVLVPGIGSCIDGGFSNDAPCLDSYTITVSALHREADVRPLPPRDKAGERGHPSFLDVIITPTYDRVWELAALGEKAAEQCKDFARPEWNGQLQKPTHTTPKEPA